MHLSVVIKLLKIGREHQNLSMNVSSLIVILSVMYKIEVEIAPIKTENFWGCINDIDETILQGLG